MARVRSTARVAREGEETRTSKIAPISKMMKRFGLVVQEDKGPVPIEDVVDAEAETTTAETDSENKDDGGILSLSKPNHIEFEKSTVKAEDQVLLKKLGYFGDNDDELVRFAREEVIPEPKVDGVVVFKSFLRGRTSVPPI
jgi:hypothetical protein